MNATDWKELASRECDGLVVSLFWSRATNQIHVAVADLRLDEEFHLDVPGACALDAFYHPFAYASAQRFCSGDAFPASFDLQRQTVAERSAVS